MNIKTDEDVKIVVVNGVFEGRLQVLSKHLSTMPVRYF